MSNQLNELDELFHSKQIVTDVLTQKLNIIRLAKNTLSQYEFRDCVEAFCNRLESILDSKSSEFKESFIQNSTNPESYCITDLKCANILKIPESSIEDNYVYDWVGLVLKYLNRIKEFKSGSELGNLILRADIQESDYSNLHYIKIYEVHNEIQHTEMCRIRASEGIFGEIYIQGLLINLDHIQKYYDFLIYILDEYIVDLFIWNFETKYLFIEGLNASALNGSERLNESSNFSEFVVVLNKALELYPDSLINLNLGVFTNKKYPNVNIGIDMKL